MTTPKITPALAFLLLFAFYLHFYLLFLSDHENAKQLSFRKLALPIWFAALEEIVKGSTVSSQKEHL